MATTVFQVTVQNATGQPLPGVGLRLLAPDGTDKTAQRFGQSPVYTNTSGVFSKTYSGGIEDLLEQGLPEGVYSIVAAVAGYQQTTISTGDFIGYGIRTITMLPSGIGVSVEVEYPEPGYVSPMAPIEIRVPGVSPYAAWEYIEATISSDDSVSVMEVPVINGLARLNIQARLELDPVLHLVGDGVGAIADVGFAKKFSIDLVSLTETGSIALNEGFSIWSANAFPIAAVNDLTNFTNINGLADWLTPWDELPKFKGHYADAMIWLPVPSSSGYELLVEYQNVNRTSLQTSGSVLPTGAFSLGNTVKVRIPDPVAGAHYAILTLTLGGTAKSKPLTVHYVNG